MKQRIILVVDDERSIRSSLKMILEYDSFTVLEAADGLSAIDIARKTSIDAVLLDIKMPGMDGLETLRHLVADHPSLPVIILSGHGTIATAVEATKLGAFHFLEKPLQRERILETVRNALDLRQSDTLASHADIPKIPDFIVGNSEGIRHALATARKVAPSKLSVLIRGESGTGKELIARAIHQFSPRRDAAFVQVNCAAIPEELIENELFGHEKGSYTGAGSAEQGKFELANEGTLFLDEIGDMSLKTQAKVLRALQEGEFQRVGGTRTLYSDVRVIAATNQDLESLIQDKLFREDLYFRINVVPIFVPPLRERLDDLPALVAHFSAEFAKMNAMAPARFDASAMSSMKQYTWPGNIRELKNFVERHLILAPGAVISSGDVEKDMESGGTGVAVSDIQGTTMNIEGETLQEFKESAERQFLIRKLRENNWNIKATAEAIGTPRSNLYKRMQYYGINRDSINQ